jgi:phosphoglucosamine mutase
VALGEVLGEGRAGSDAILVGGDTRDSTPSLCAWLVEGLARRGSRCRVAGVAPTPAISAQVRATGAPFGLAVSASHNLHPDNGIKLIAADGGKWTEAAERAIEARWRERLAGTTAATPSEVVDWEALRVDATLVGNYVTGLVGALEAGAFAGLRVVVDAAHGAAAPIAARPWLALGAEVETLGASPDGTNINRGCGSTHPEPMAAATRAHRAHLGVALDGDGDRAVFADENGTVRDGDATLYVWARALHAAGRLDPPAIVATSMSNLGLERALARHGITVVRCDVGDRAVVEALRREGLVLGGEQSGHIVHRGLGPTGDGLMTALQIANVLARSGQRFSELLSDFEVFPQLLRNVRVREKRPLDSLVAVTRARAAAERALGAEGRLVLRYSGTEPLARIMLEGPDRATIERWADQIEAALREDLGAGES